MKTYTLEEARVLARLSGAGLSSEWLGAWMNLRDQMDYLEGDGAGRGILTRYSWSSPHDFMEAQAEVLRLRGCKDAREILAESEARFIEDALA